MHAISHLGDVSSLMAPWLELRRIVLLAATFCSYNHVGRAVTINPGFPVREDLFRRERTVVSDASKYSANESATGYLFQCRYALLASLRRMSEREDDFVLSIETLDDVVFERQGHPKELLQLKHHINHAANLSDASVDLWKTLRIWCEGYSQGLIDSESIHYLITTSVAADESAASYLMIEGRSVDAAIGRLLQTARSSQNATNAKAYEAFLALTDVGREDLIGRIFVLDKAPTIMEVFDGLNREVRWAVASQYRDVFVQRLEGWWFRRVVAHLVAKEGSILSQEIDSEMNDLREQFKEDNLPIDVLELEIEHKAFLNEQFVHQLKLIDVGNPRIRIAIREYFRAFEQRSRWVREDLLHVGELGKYERRLIEEWEILFERMRDELGEDAAEAKKKEAAQALYKWIESEANFPIRPRCGEPFVTRGTYHILANGAEPRVGWHPDFLARVKALLGAEADA
jgi:hypothetical protein